MVCCSVLRCWTASVKPPRQQHQYCPCMHLLQGLRICSSQLALLRHGGTNASVFHPLVCSWCKYAAPVPACLPRAQVVAALQETSIPFQAFDILNDEGVRQGLKEYSNWPTYPQLYVKGELLGGCDIVLEMQVGAGSFKL